MNFTLPRAGAVTVRVFSSAGREVATLYDGVMGAGPQKVTWNVGRDVKPGVYFYQVWRRSAFHREDRTND
jgi:hypothetical protein